MSPPPGAGAPLGRHVLPRLARRLRLPGALAADAAAVGRARHAAHEAHGAPLPGHRVPRPAAGLPTARRGAQGLRPEALEREPLRWAAAEPREGAQLPEGAGAPQPGALSGRGDQGALGLRGHGSLALIE